MKTDRELTELAARSAGINVQWNPMRECFEIPGPSPTNIAKSWNPLTDDGDALRLAVQLRMAMDVSEYGLVAFCGQGLSREVKNEDIDGDPYVATRRAIVRAAAALVAG